MSHGQSLTIAESRKRLLAAIGKPPDLTLVRPPGNRGDDLIMAGNRHLLEGMRFREIAAREVSGAGGGHTVLFGGSGGWCGPFHGLEKVLHRLEREFERVILLPSSFDVSVPSVKETLAETRALVFARERISFEQIRDLCECDLAHDGALYFDYEPYRRQGEGVLTAFRTDFESPVVSVPAGNRDLSVECKTLEEWLRTIAAHDRIRTDRAHIVVAGALLGKQVEYRASSYHKIPAMVDFSLQGFPVTRLCDTAPETDTTGSVLTDTGRMGEVEKNVQSLVPHDSRFILVDNGQLPPFPHSRRVRVPFLEKDGAYWGNPGDDATAIRELERLRGEGAGFLFLAWPAMWWIDHYREFLQYLTEHYTRVLANDVVVAFDLRADR